MGVHYLEKRLVGLDESFLEREEHFVEQALYLIPVQRERVLPMDSIGIRHEIQAVAPAMEPLQLKPRGIGNAGMHGIPGVYHLLLRCARTAQGQYLVKELRPCESPGTAKKLFSTFFSFWPCCMACGILLSSLI